MHHSRITFAVLTLMLYVGSGVLAEESGLKLRMQPELIPYSIGRDEPSTLFIDAQRIEGNQEQELNASGSVRLRRRGTAVFSDQIHLNIPDEQLTATGHVRFEKQGDIVTGEALFYDLNYESGTIDKPTYQLPRFGARGKAERLVAENPNLTRIDKATYTTCDVGDDEWLM